MRGPARPPRALRRAPWTAAALAALDFETTGLDPARDAVVSFGVVPVLEGRVVVGEAVYREVAPSAPLTATSIVVHGLRPADLAGAPGLEEARVELATALAGRFVLAWAAGVEAGFLARIFGGSTRAWRRRIIDVLRLAEVAGEVPEDGRPSLAAVAARLRVPVERPHHALDDALTTAQVFLVLASRLAPRGYDTPGRLLRASRSVPAPRGPGRVAAGAA
ncbi:MAG: DNA polymerase III subunit epsilon [Actinomycetota bacterium]|nr:MAG: DNA polymerase III subunit epsilon [Actinomycetota bacterium]